MLIKENELTKNSSDSEIMDAVEDYVSGLDDYDYYLISEIDKEKIQENLKNLLTNN